MWHIIANPVAGGGAVERRWPAIERLLQELGFAYSVQFTTGAGHAIRLAEDAVLRGARQILGIGGDGTNHEIINGIMRQQRVPPADVCYALLPVGTGNDWARHYGLSHDPRTRLEALLAGRTVWQDVGHVRYREPGTGEERERYFVNVAGLAYDAYIARELRGLHGIGRLRYLWMVARHLFNYRLLPARIVFDGRVADSSFYTINIGICKYSGGGMQLVPQAVPDDGWLALTFARRVSKLTVLLQTPRFYNGTLLQHPRIEGHQAQTIHVVPAAGGPPTLLEADGEFLGETPAEFSIFARAIQVLI